MEDGGICLLVLVDDDGCRFIGCLGEGVLGEGFAGVGKLEAKCDIGYGKVAVGLLYGKCCEHTREYFFGVQIFPFLSILLMSWIHLLRPSGFLASVGKGNNLNGGSQIHSPTPFLYPTCMLQSMAFHFCRPYSPLPQPCTAHIGIMI